MTNNDDLAQRMKENRFELIRPANVIALLAERDADKKRIAELEALATEYGMKFQRAQDDLKKMAMMHAHANVHYADAAELEISTLRQRIVDLEARTVSVKLPKLISVLHRRDFIDAHRAIYAYPEAEVNAALDAAGIKLEVGE